MPSGLTSTSGPIYFIDHPEFKPNLTPFQVLGLGCFCDQGGYFRPIYSDVLRTELSDKHVQVPCFKRQNYGLNYELDYDSFIRTYVCLDRPTPSRNLYNTRCGLDLKAWEAAGWIKSPDPYGWFQWYCHFYYGRRIDGYDEYQIKRWIGVVNRFKNRVHRSEKVKQVLIGWGYTIEQRTFIQDRIRRNLRFKY